MADAQPTIRLTDRKGVSVLVAGGAWTVFSLRGVSRQIETLRKGGKSTPGNTRLRSRKANQSDNGH